MMYLHSEKNECNATQRVLGKWSMTSKTYYSNVPNKRACTFIRYIRVIGQFIKKEK